MSEQQETASPWVTVRLERVDRDRLLARQGKIQAERERYVTTSDALKWLLDLADAAVPGLTPAARERLAQYQRAIAKAEDRYVTAGQAVERLMDWADAADLP